MSSCWPQKVIIYTDGASRGNPGPSALGIVIMDTTGQVVAEISEPLGRQTNNYAEYQAVLRALQLAREQGVKEVVLRSDSQLMVKQMIGEYQIKAPGLRPLYNSCQAEVKYFTNVNFEHVPREQNKLADSLANQALDRQKASSSSSSSKGFA